MKQTVAHKKLGALQGLLLVLGLVALLFVINYAANTLVARYLGNAAATIGFYLLGGLVAWQVLRVYITNIVYELGDDVLRLTRKYGKRERLIEDIYLSRLLYVGTPEEAKRRYSRAVRVNAVCAGSKAPVTAVAYQSSSGVRIALLQANDELKARLVEKIKAK